MVTIATVIIVQVVLVDIQNSNKKIKQNKMKIERPNSVIKVNITPLTADKKTKIASAVQEVVNKIKTKHLS